MDKVDREDLVEIFGLDEESPLEKMLSKLETTLKTARTSQTLNSIIKTGSMQYMTLIHTELKMALDVYKKDRDIGLLNDLKRDYNIYVAILNKHADENDIAEHFHKVYK